MDPNNPNPVPEVTPRPASTVFVGGPVVGTVTPAPIAKKPKRIGKVLAFALSFVLFVGMGFVVGHKLLQKQTSSSTYTKYSGSGSFSFDYPKGWILKEEDTTKEKYGAYKVTVSTADYAEKEGEDTLIETTTKGYRFTVYYSKNDGIIKDTDAMYKYLTDEKVTGLKKLKTQNGTVLVQNVDQPSELFGEVKNSKTTSFYSKDDYDYTLYYNYPGRKDSVADETYLKQYEHLLNTFTEKK